MRQNDLQDKNIVVMGLGLDESGVTMARYYARKGANVLITDLRTSDQLKPSIEKLKKYKNVRYRLGGHKESDFTGADIVCRNPAIKPGNQFIRIAQENGAKIIMELALFHQLCPCRIVGITGTRGKSTTTALITHILKEGGSEILQAGNMGIDALSSLEKLSPDDIAVLEISSFQLDGMNEVKVSPYIGLITNIFPDHLDWHGSLEKYIEAKKVIFKYQSKTDCTIVNSDNQICRGLSRYVPGNLLTYSLYNPKASYHYDATLSKIFEGDSEFIDLRKLGNSLLLRGKHNLYNIIAAAAVTNTLSINPAIFLEALKGWPGLPGRQEIVNKLK